MTDLDVLARGAIDGARREAASLDVPSARDVTARRAAIRRRHRVVAALSAVVVAGGAVVAVGATSRDSRRPAVAVTPTTVPGSRRAHSVLGFREVLSVQNFKGCKPTAYHPKSQAVLPDRTRTYCYYVGPVLVDGSAVESADAALDRISGEWTVNVRFRNDDFVTKVAKPTVGRQIVIAVDGVVQSAPTVNFGITGRDVTISGTFTQLEAQSLARRISP